MAWTKVNFALLQKIDVATSMRADGVQRLNLIASSAQIHRANWNLREFVPRIYSVRKDRKFTGNPVIRKCFKAGDMHRGIGACFSPKRVEKNFQTSDHWNNSQYRADNRGQKAFQKVA